MSHSSSASPPKTAPRKVRRAIDRGTDTVLVVGGDGMVNTIGSELVNTDVRLGVVPAGSGNGFARHFKIPLHPIAAAQALLTATPHPSMSARSTTGSSS